MRKRSRVEARKQRQPGFGESEVVIARDGRVSIMRPTSGLAEVARELARGATADQEASDGSDETR